MGKQLKTLISMKETLTKHLGTVRDSVKKGKYNSNKHDVKVLVGGKEFSLEYNADLHDGLESFVEEQIKMEK